MKRTLFSLQKRRGSKENKKENYSGCIDRRKQQQQVYSLKMKKSLSSPLFDGHVSGSHHVAQLASLLRLNQAGCVFTAVRLRVCGWRPTRTPGHTRYRPGRHHSGVWQLWEHERTSTGVSKINNITSLLQLWSNNTGRFVSFARHHSLLFHCSSALLGRHSTKWQITSIRTDDFFDVWQHEHR